MTLPKKVKITQFTDSRGSLFFPGSELDVLWKRFYVIENLDEKPVRGWHGHFKERKLVMAIAGSFRIGVVSLEGGPISTNPVHEFQLDSAGIDALFIPSNSANCIESLGSGSRLLVLSDLSVKESEEDIIRFPIDEWKFNG